LLIIDMRLMKANRILRKLYRRATAKNVFKMLMKTAVFFSIFSFIFLNFSIITTGIILTVFVLFTGKSETVEIFIKTLPRDLIAAYRLAKFSFLNKRNTKHNLTIPKLFSQKVHAHPLKLALQQEDVKWTYKMLDDYSNAFANYFRKQGISAGDTVSIFVDNRPEYVAIWLGLSKIGAISALINYNLRKDSLLHCIQVSNSKAVIAVARLKDAVREVMGKLDQDVKYYSLVDDVNSEGFTDDFICIDNVVNSESHMPPPDVDARYSDKLMYIYTSGTTGVPKAAVISHSRFYCLATLSHLMLGYKQNDKIYCILPLYHSNGGIVGIGQTLLHGIPCYIRTKFSASRFWTDCLRYDCTVFLYIGEICRYLLAQPERKSDKDHNIRVCSGNGLRPEIWEEFVKRFNIGKVAELYGSTEGNANMMNIMNVTGSCGFTSVIAPSFFPLVLVKVDEEMNFIKDSNGFCIKCEPGEQGMMIGQIKSGNASREFDGYANKQATNSKIMYNVFQDGDKWFLSGDVLVQDKYGNMYFKDRTGDTFRWKGENVSTAECEAELSKIHDNKFTVAVYGVSIPGTDGKAGMATVEDEGDQLDLSEFYLGAAKVLPSYARPIFVRIVKKIDMTGTHKLAKSRLRREGFDINSIDDPVYVVDHANKTYKLLDSSYYNEILAGSTRL